MNLSTNPLFLIFAQLGVTLPPEWEIVEAADLICQRAHEAGNLKQVDGQWLFMQG
jgi:hypothetical protein